MCEARLLLTRLSCDECGTELSGAFEPCDFCALSGEDRDLLRVFLVSRGNMKEVERFLGVSYPTARARYDDLLGRLGLQAPAADPFHPSDPVDPVDPKVAVLDALRRGEISVAEADERLGR